jgi:hypothetical protein
MVMANLPYVMAVGTLEGLLDKIQSASVPEKFSQDFVATKLLVKGGAGRALIPFVKRMGLVSADGTPTDRYKAMRNPEKAGSAVADAMRSLYGPLFEMNEKVYDLEPSKVKSLIVEATGAEPDSAVVQKTLSTFQALRKRADFKGMKSTAVGSTESDLAMQIGSPRIVKQQLPAPVESVGEGINLSYTINLNLPATTDIEVFNAIFKSLKTHLIQE